MLYSEVFAAMDYCVSAFRGERGTRIAVTFNDECIIEARLTITTVRSLLLNALPPFPSQTVQPLSRIDRWF